MVQPSRKRVQCGHLKDGRPCTFNGQSRHYPRHLKSQHPGKQAKIITPLTQWLSGRPEGASAEVSLTVVGTGTGFSRASIYDVIGIM